MEKIEEDFAPEGLKAVAKINGCKGCFYRHKTKCSPICLSSNRLDGRSVIFVPKDEAVEASDGSVQ